MYVCVCVCVHACVYVLTSDPLSPPYGAECVEHAGVRVVSTLHMRTHTQQQWNAYSFFINQVASVPISKAVRMWAKRVFDAVDSARVKDKDCSLKTIVK